MTIARVAQSIPHGRFFNRPLTLAFDAAQLAGTRTSGAGLCRTLATSNRPDLKNPSRNDNPEIPKFSLKNLGATPRLQRVLIASIVILGIMESLAWIKFLPKITGRSRQEPPSSTGSKR